MSSLLTRWLNICILAWWKDILVSWFRARACSKAASQSCWQASRWSHRPFLHASVLTWADMPSDAGPSFVARGDSEMNKWLHPIALIICLQRNLVKYNPGKVVSMCLSGITAEAIVRSACMPETTVGHKRREDVEMSESSPGHWGDMAQSSHLGKPWGW